MSIPDESADQVAIRTAHAMADAGVPIFCARIKRDGEPDRTDRRWDNWQHTEAGESSHAAVDRWKPGMALCAVTGIAMDVIDIDPRNGGLLSLKRFNKELGDNGPVTYYQVKTPSGGWHLYIAPTDVGGRNGFLPGMDLKSGQADGSGRGFVFLPPTVRPSKETGEFLPYVATEPWSAPGAGDKSGRAMVAWLETISASASGKRGGRAGVSELKSAVLAAGPGEQREALLRYVHELERRGIEREDILDLLRVLCRKLTNYSARDPWYPARGGNPDSHLLGLLHKAGEIVGDADEDEERTISALGDGNRAVNMMGFEPLSRVQRDPIKWLWRPFLSMGNLTVMDGEKGNAKSLIVIDVAARYTSGRPMPDGAECGIEPGGTVLLLGEEDDRNVLSARAEAAGADMTRIMYRNTASLRTGKKRAAKGAVVGEEFALPNGAANIARLIAATGAVMVVFDPINDFMASDIQTHNDASVRSALRPLAIELARLGVVGWAIRHMNKAAGADARMRGAGSTAYQNRARVHLAVGRMPDSYDGPGAHGLTILDTNIARRPAGVLAYSIEDSDIPLDDQGGMAPYLEWHGWQESVSANAMVGADSAKSGRPMSAVSNSAMQALEEMFERRSVWPATAAVETLREEFDVTVNKDQLAKIRARMGIGSRPLRRRGAAGVRGWEWFREQGDGNGGTRARMRSGD